MAHDGPLAVGPNGETIHFERVAMTPQHVGRFALPEHPCPSDTDKDKGLRDKFSDRVAGGDVNIELNALKELQRDYFVETTIKGAIHRHLDTDTYPDVAFRADMRRWGIQHQARELEGETDIADSITAMWEFFDEYDVDEWPDMLDDARVRTDLDDVLPDGDGGDQ